MADATSKDDVSAITINIKGPSELKISVSIQTDATIRQLKEKIESEKSDFPADSQRLIYSGKVLKDEETVAFYKMQAGHTVHMVRSATRSAPTTGNPQTAASSATSGAGASATRNATASSTGVPSTFGTGQNFGTDPLAALNRADLAGPHLTSLLSNPFGGTGLNPNDPNMMMDMMNNPQFQAHMRSMLARPEVVDQIIASNPQLASMGPQFREMMRSEQFREMLTNPEMMRQMAQMRSMFGGAGGSGGGLGGLPDFGGAAGGGRGGAVPFPPPGAFDTTQGGGAAGTGGASAAPNLDGLLAALGGNPSATGANPRSPGAGAGAGNPFGNPELLRQLLGQGGGFGGFGQGAGGNDPLAALLGGFPGASAAPRDTRPPEERFASQLEQMQAMGFYDGAANLRALLTSGGSVEGAITILLEGPPGGGAQ